MDLFEKGISEYKKGNFEESLVIFHQLVLSSPKHPPYLHYRARVQSRLGKLDGAIKDFDLLTEIHPHDTNYISDRAVVLHLLSRNEEAMAAFDKALNLDPKNPYRFSSRAYFKDRIGDLKGAIEDYETAISLDPEDAVAFNNKGLVEEKLGYKEAAIKSMGKADELSGYQAPPADIQKTDPEKSFPNSFSKDNFLQDDPFHGTDRKLRPKQFLEVFRDIFSNSKTRQEFWGFIKSKFKKS